MDIGHKTLTAFCPFHDLVRVKFFFFQAEDGIRDIGVTGVQTCALPILLKEAAYGVGCTTWEVVRNVVIPYTRVGVIGGIMLALGRALGETMAVTFIIGNSFRISGSIFSPGTTISAAIASEFAESDGLHQSGLILLGLLLLVLRFFVLVSPRVMLMRLVKKVGL